MEARSPALQVDSLPFEPPYQLYFNKKIFLKRKNLCPPGPCNLEGNSDNKSEYIYIDIYIIYIYIYYRIDSKEKGGLHREGILRTRRRKYRVDRKGFTEKVAYVQDR